MSHSIQVVNGANIRYGCRRQWREEGNLEAPIFLSTENKAVWLDEAKKIELEEMQSGEYDA